MTMFTEQDYINAYKSKKASAKSRGIDFELTQEYYIALMKMRPTMTCFYSGRKFVMDKGSTHQDFGTLERLDPLSGYTVSNTVLCTHYCNGLKEKYIEKETSRKGITETQMNVLKTIEKTLNMSGVREERLQPYQDLYNKADQRKKEVEQKEVHRIQRDEALEKQKKVIKVKAQMEEQRALATHYGKIYDLFESMGLQYGLSFKDHRDRFRISRSALSKVKFKTLEDKYLWIPDKVTVGGKGIVEKGDFLVCFKEESELLDKLSQSGNLKTVALNVLKHI